MAVYFQNVLLPDLKKLLQAYCFPRFRKCGIVLHPPFFFISFEKGYEV